MFSWLHIFSLKLTNTFNLFVSLYLKSLFSRTYMKIFETCFFIQCGNLLPFNKRFRPFIIIVIIGTVRLKSTIYCLIFIYCTFSLSFFYFMPFFLDYCIWLMIPFIFCSLNINNTFFFIWVATVEFTVYIFNFWGIYLQLII